MSFYVLNSAVTNLKYMKLQIKYMMSGLNITMVKGGTLYYGYKKSNTL